MAEVILLLERMEGTGLKTTVTQIVPRLLVGVSSVTLRRL